MDKIGKSGNFKEVYFFSVSAPEYKEIIIIIVLFPPIYEKIYIKYIFYQSLLYDGLFIQKRK